MLVGADQGHSYLGSSFSVLHPRAKFLTTRCSGSSAALPPDELLMPALLRAGSLTSAASASPVAAHGTRPSLQQQPETLTLCSG